jgi:hypothetical protein
MVQRIDIDFKLQEIDLLIFIVFFFKDRLHSFSNKVSRGRSSVSRAFYISKQDFEKKHLLYVHIQYWTIS